MMEFYRHSTHVAKKEHICELCNESIPVGTLYSKECGKYDDEFFERKLHPICYEAVVAYCSDVDNEFTYEDVNEYITEQVCMICSNRDKCIYPGIYYCPKVKRYLGVENEEIK